MVASVFIDGEAGTTGLQISARLSGRDDLVLLRLGDHERKDLTRRKTLLNEADMVILCLPDDAAREAVSLIDSPNTRVIDASTAHRTAEGWVYGMPEYDLGHEETIKKAKRVTNPGCYANASIAILHPLIKGGILPTNWPITINAVSGYSGGGKGMIASFEDPSAADYTDDAFMVYGLTLEHKHVPEIQRRSGLTNRPLFMPSVARYRQGMIVQVPLQLNALPGSPSVKDIHSVLEKHYSGRQYITVAPLSDTAAMGKLTPESLNGSNEMRLHVFGNDEYGQAVVMGLLDNLGKGASGQAIQNMNLMLGLDENAGLSVAKA